MAFDIMKTTLENGETLKIAGFGNFVVKQKNDRTGRNPQTGEAKGKKIRKSGKPPAPREDLRRKLQPPRGRSYSWGPSALA